jgi:uncharacterized membrane protein YraQ (UPF0718 family)
MAADLVPLAFVTHSVGRALSFAFGMFWEILWALILGLFLSGAVQAVVRKSEMRRLMGDDSPRSIAIATLLGAASSSCSYAAVALARSLFRKGASFTAAMAFEIASTNLVVELGIIMALVLGWQFTVGEFVGGPLMIVIVVFLFRRLLTCRLLDKAREQADRGLIGSMEGHAEMDMSVARQGTILQRLLSRDGFDAAAAYFVMDWAAVARDIFGGLLIAGALAAWVPDSFWRSLFLEHHGGLSTIWGPVIGPLVAVISFVCSIGNVPLAAVLCSTCDRRRNLLCGHGHRGTCRRSDLQGGRPRPHDTRREGRRSERPPELHDRSQHRLSSACRSARLPLPPKRRGSHATSDEQADRRPRAPHDLSRGARPRLRAEEQSGALAGLCHALDVAGGVAGRVGEEHFAAVGEPGDAGGEVDGGSEPVACSVHGCPVMHADPDRGVAAFGQQIMREREPELDRIGGLIDAEH